MKKDQPIEFKKLSKDELMQIIDTDYSEYKIGFRQMLTYICFGVGSVPLLEGVHYLMYPGEHLFRSIHFSTVVVLATVMAIGFCLISKLLAVNLRKLHALIELLRKSKVIKP